MAQNKQEIRSRIRSVQSTKKITNAMELMATSKLKKQKELMLANKEYAEYLKDTVQRILQNVEFVENAFLETRTEGNPITIFFTSDMGLCGGYNVNLFRLLEEELPADSPIIVVGKRGYPWLLNRKYNVINSLTGSDDITFTQLKKLTNQAIEMYLNKEVSCIQVLYSKFVNSISFEPTLVKLLPVEKDQDFSSEHHTETIFEPNANAVLNDLVPMYLRSLVYSYWIETKTSEQASRRLAMETATDNAQELIDQLLLQYNRARQAAITQEITEIVAGADAL